jgi:hypothetical protein
MPVSLRASSSNSKPAEGISSSLVRKESYDALVHADHIAVPGNPGNNVTAEVINSGGAGTFDIILSTNGFLQLTGSTMGSATVDWRFV